MKWTNDFIFNQPTWTLAELAPHAMRIAPQRWKGNVNSCRCQLSQIANAQGCSDINGNSQNKHFNQPDAKKIMDECLAWQVDFEKKEKKREEALKAAQKKDNISIPSVFDMSAEIKSLREYIEDLEARIAELESNSGNTQEEN